MNNQKIIFFKTDLIPFFSKGVRYFNEVSNGVYITYSTSKGESNNMTRVSIWFNYQYPKTSNPFTDMFTLGRYVMQEQML